ncbi:type II toxin-antitoxin system Phd/YefM family antitoxin [Phyllobacterium chamaecytisi]|nr:type II toxin-antitoxin system Phd/YefM family antitoxin [Phyllobacterium sp. KW56]
MESIGLREARASFSTIVDEAFAGEPVAMTRHGRTDVVLLSFEE